ncbi:MAG: menaquinone biosynthesis decarboxylase [Planctomycetes bacterium]|jgi:4-hydroxy-3-polyprenylbenzoate decarboxylase|nr:menaquinone biosynthesis decarboxylase [Planctomycetota bacterium]MBT4028410.1 menaquinone biosynthesis decarboxylase [Planctomycetota bacterium]MBT4559719.1 menaquinone biosynthesis decarboxylase [Planctomycetota bacterium]MBT5102038.1 menaquinone biosynthesis decarboxylase [Planctomycetota bacterium]MBT7319463.1 menaquinone biosynthesis decarboxylase [Planctomycetota bacterium]
MVINSLSEWIAVLDDAGELIRISAEVDPKLELSEIVDRISKEQGAPNRAVLFENVKGSALPVFVNAFGSRERVGLSLGVNSMEDHAARLEDLLEQSPPEGLLEKLKMLPKLAQVGKWFPKKVSSSPCQEVVLKGDDVDLGLLPVLTTWPDDAGPFITFPLCVTNDPETGRRNMGTYRLQVMGKTETGFHSHLHKDARRHLNKAQESGDRIPVAVVIGADPATCFASVVPAPPDVDELMLAGFLRNKPVPLVPCLTVPLEVPATAEIVLEGWVDPAEVRREGPFGDHTGFYSLADDYPVFHVECMTMRKNAVYHTTLVGRPPQEDCWMTEGIERLLLPVLRKQFPEVLDYRMPFEGVAHNLMYLKIKKQYPGHARKLMNAIWGLGQAMFTKVIVVVDDDCDIHSDSEVAWRVLNNIDPQRDLEFTLGPMEVLDHASRSFCYGSKVGIDATKKMPEEGFQREWPDAIVMDAETKSRVSSRWSEFGLS